MFCYGIRKGTELNKKLLWLERRGWRCRYGRPLWGWLWLWCTRFRLRVGSITSIWLRRAKLISKLWNGLIAGLQFLCKGRGTWGCWYGRSFRRWRWLRRGEKWRIFLFKIKAVGQKEIPQYIRRTIRFHCRKLLSHLIPSSRLELRI